MKITPDQQSKIRSLMEAFRFGWLVAPSATGGGRRSGPIRITGGAVSESGLTAALIMQRT